MKPRTLDYIRRAGPLVSVFVSKARKSYLEPKDGKPKCWCCRQPVKIEYHAAPRSRLGFSDAVD